MAPVADADVDAEEEAPDDDDDDDDDDDADDDADNAAADDDDEDAGAPLEGPGAAPPPTPPPTPPTPPLSAFMLAQRRSTETTESRVTPPKLLKTKTINSSINPLHNQSINQAIHQFNDLPLWLHRLASLFRVPPTKTR